MNSAKTKIQHLKKQSLRITLRKMLHQTYRVKMQAHTKEEKVKMLK